MKFRERRRNFLCSPSSHTVSTSVTRMAHLFTRDVPTLTQNWLWHVMHLRVHSWWCTFSVPGQMCNGRDSPLPHHSVFTALKTCALPHLPPPPPPPLATINLFIVSLVSCLFQNLPVFQIKSIESQKLKEGQLSSQEAEGVHLLVLKVRVYF